MMNYNMILKQVQDDERLFQKDERLLQKDERLLQDDERRIGVGV